MKDLLLEIRKRIALAEWQTGEKLFGEVIFGVQPFALAPDEKAKVMIFPHVFSYQKFETNNFLLEETVVKIQMIFAYDNNEENFTKALESFRIFLTFMEKDGENPDLQFSRTARDFQNLTSNIFFEGKFLVFDLTLNFELPKRRAGEK